MRGVRSTNSKLTLFSTQNLDRSSSDDSSDSDDDSRKSFKKKDDIKFVKFRCCSPVVNNQTNKEFFVIDRDADTVKVVEHGIEFEGIISVSSEKEMVENVFALGSTEQEDVDPFVEKMLEKSVVGPGFEKYLGEGHKVVSARAMRCMRKKERDRTAGDKWFNMPASELTENRKRDLELLAMRGVIYEKTRYRKRDRKGLPKYFQVGTVVDSSTEFYSSRIPLKNRKQTIADELLADAEFQAKQRKKYNEIRARDHLKRKGAFQHGKHRRKKHSKCYMKS